MLQVAFFLTDKTKSPVWLEKLKVDSRTCEMKFNKKKLPENVNDSRNFKSIILIAILIQIFYNPRFFGSLDCQNCNFSHVCLYSYNSTHTTANVFPQTRWTEDQLIM